MPGSATEREAAVRAAFAAQAGWCEKGGAPFMALLCRVLGERIDRTSEVGRRVLDWPGDSDPIGDALALRLCGGLHALVRSGAAPALAALYPPRPAPDAEALWAELRPVLGDPALLPWLDGPPQTNEVGRSAVLMSGLHAVTARYSWPLDLLELGASAGLNLLPDLYGYDLGGLRSGDAASPVHLKPQWLGPPPPAGQVTVASRRGVDINPLDPRRDGARLIAYVWPDQQPRIARLEAVLALAAKDPPMVDRGDAAEWLEAQLAEPPREGRTRIVFHSVAFHYFPAATRASVGAAMEKAGEAASEAAPLGWLRYEVDSGDRFTLRLRLWPDREDRLLAETNPHGASVSWLEPPAH